MHPCFHDLKHQQPTNPMLRLPISWLLRSSSLCQIFCCIVFPNRYEVTDKEDLQNISTRCFVYTSKISLSSPLHNAIDHSLLEIRNIMFFYASSSCSFPSPSHTPPGRNHNLQSRLTQKITHCNKTIDNNGFVHTFRLQLDSFRFQFEPFQKLNSSL